MDEKKKDDRLQIWPGVLAADIQRALMAYINETKIVNLSLGFQAEPGCRFNPPKQNSKGNSWNKINLELFSLMLLALRGIFNLTYLPSDQTLALINALQHVDCLRVLFCGVINI